MVHRGGHAGVGLHAARFEILLLGVKRIPVSLRGALRESRPPVEQPVFAQSTDTRISHFSPAFRVTPTVSVDEAGGRLNRRVIRLEGEVGKEGPAGSLACVEVLNRLVDKKRRGVKVLGQRRKSFAIRVPAGFRLHGQVGTHFKVVGTAVGLDERVVKTAGGGQVSGTGTKMPLAGNRGAITRGLQETGYRPHKVIQYTRVAGLTAVRQGHQFAHT